MGEKSWSAATTSGIWVVDGDGLESDHDISLTAPKTSEVRTCPHKSLQTPRKGIFWDSDGSSRVSLTSCFQARY